MNSIVCFYVNQYDSHHNLIKKREYHLEKAPGCQFGTIFGSLEEEVSGISIEIKNPETENLSQIQNLRIDLLENDKKFKKIPIGVIGGIYLNNEEISECLQDMIDNNSHYLKTAIAFSKEYYQFHNSTTLIKLLTDSNKNENKVKISESPSCF